MNKRLLGLPVLTALLLPALVAGCAMRGGHHGRMGMDHHASNMDVNSMCTMHKQMMEGKTDAQQQALMEEHMKSMTPEMRQRMQEMHARCR